MLKELWRDLHRSVCSISFLINGKRISSGTGFRVGTKIITNNHVIQVPPATHVIVHFVGADGHSRIAEKAFSQQEFRSHLIDGEPESSWDYAILDMEIDEFKEIPTLRLKQDDDIAIGTTIALLGFQFDQSNLSIHTGILSSKYIRAGVNYLQLDASVNNGNSGGPLILPETGEIIGIVTRKATGLTQQFDGLIASFENNIRVLKSTGGVSMSIGGVNPIEALIATQAQLGQVAAEIQRSANVGVGYAYELRKVRESFALKS